MTSRHIRGYKHTPFKKSLFKNENWIWLHFLNHNEKKPEVTWFAKSNPSPCAPDALSSLMTYSNSAVRNLGGTLHSHLKLDR